MIGQVTILIIRHLLISLSRGMSICLLQSFPGSCGKKICMYPSCSSEEIYPNRPLWYPLTIIWRLFMHGDK